MRLKLAYAILAVLLIVGVAAGVMTTGRKSHAVVKTKTVHTVEQAAYEGPDSLLTFLAKSILQAEEIQCPKDLPAGSTCLRLRGKDFFIFFAFPQPTTPAA